MASTGQLPDGAYSEYCEKSFCLIQLRLTEGIYASDLEGFRAYIGYDTKTGVSFIVDSGPSAADGQVIIDIYEQKVGTSTPTFMYCTHGHPDHVGGYNTLAAKWPAVPIYIGIRGTLDAMTYFTPNAAYLSNVEVLKEDLSYWGSGSVVNVVDFPSMETTYASMLYLNIYGEKMLFTGDIVMPRSHLYVSNGLNGWGTYPYIDDALCQWATKLISLQCTLDEDIRIFPGHGPASEDYEETNDMDWSEAIQESVTWIKEYRQVAYNTCNASKAWQTMIEKYPHFGFRRVGYYSYGLINWFPYAANAVGCNCVSSGQTDGPYTIYTPNECNTPAASIPRCPVFDTSYSLDARCAMLGVSTETAYLSSQEYSTSSGGNDDVFTQADGQVILGVSIATLLLAGLAVCLGVWNLIAGRNRAPPLAKQSGDQNL